MTLKSIFVIAITGEIIYETSGYDFIIPRETMISVRGKLYIIKRVSLTILDDQVIYGLETYHD